MSIFKEEFKAKGNIFYFKKVGDNIEGTLVGKRITMNSFKKPPVEQNVFDILVDGEIVTNGEKKTVRDEIYTIFSKPIIDRQMELKQVKIGQIVGLKFVKINPPSTPGQYGTHVIELYADKSQINERWLKEQEDERVANGEETEEPEVSIEEVFNQNQPSSVALTPEQTLNEISRVAALKLQFTTEDEMKVKIMEVSTLAFMPVNYPVILEALKRMPDKQ